MSTGSFQKNSNVRLTADEKRLFGQLFKQCDPEGLGIVTGDVARTLFERSGLPPTVLGEIWQIADTENNGFLDQLGFSVALRVIGQVQAGQKPSPTLKDVAGPLPIFDGRPRLLGSITTGTRVPPLTPADRQRFIALFDKSAPGGILQGERARDIFTKARLSNEILGQIWNLADTQSRGQLNQTEFIIAMHLIQCTLNRSLPSLPQTLPSGLYEAAAGSSSPVLRQFTGSSAGRASPAIGQGSFTNQQPVARQPSLSGASSNEWVISPQERARFDGIFKSLDKAKQGSIGAQEVVPFLTTSKLPEDVLAQVWDLADVNNTGVFGKSEFAIAMYLVQQKLAGRALPPVLPTSLLTSGSRQPSVSSPRFPPQQQFNPQQPNPVFLPNGGQPPQSPQPVPQQPSRSGTSSALNDLAEIFATPSSRPVTAQTTKSPPPATTGSGVSRVTPQSSFDQSLARTDSGNLLANRQRQNPRIGSPQVAPQVASSVSPPSVLAPAAVSAKSTDLLADNDPEISGKLSAASTEFANLSNQITSITNQKVQLTDKREKAEAELTRLLNSKKEIEGKLAALRSSYDSEVQKVHQVQELLEKTKTEHQKLSQDYSVLDASYHAVQTQYQTSSNQLAADQQANAELKEKIKFVSDETASLKNSLEAMEKETKQQRNLVTISEKQLEAAEQERDSVRNQLGQANAELQAAREAAAREAAAVSPPAPPAAPVPQRQVHSPGNPFVNILKSADIQTPIFDQASQDASEESFRQLEVVSPSTAAKSSTFENEETPGSSPPTSDFQVYQGTAIPGFTLPLGRPESRTSSVQNNASLSVRGDLDGSQPDSPAYTSEPVSGIVPPESLEIPNAQAEHAQFMARLAQTSTATLTPPAETAAPPVRSESDIPHHMEGSSDSFEFVNAESDWKGDEKVAVPEPVAESLADTEKRPAEERKAADEPKAEEPKAEEPKAEEPKAEEPKAEEPKAEELKAEELKAEELKAEEPKTEEPKAEEPKAEEPKAEELKVEESNGEEPKADRSFGSDEYSEYGSPSGGPVETGSSYALHQLSREDGELSSSIPGGFPGVSEPAATAPVREPVTEVVSPVHAAATIESATPRAEEFESSDEEGPEDVVGFRSRNLAHKEDAVNDAGETEFVFTTSAPSEPFNVAAPGPVAAAVPPPAASTSPFAHSATSPFSTAPITAAATAQAFAAVSAPTTAQVPTPHPHILTPQFDDPFSKAFDDLDEAKEEKSGFEEFNVSQSGFDEFNSTFDTAFAAASAAPAAAKNDNDEWEQLFAGFSSNSLQPTAPPAADEIEDAFKVPGQEPAAKPGTPHSQAVADLVNMGFAEKDAREALERKNYNVTEASNYLLDK